MKEPHCVMRSWHWAQDGRVRKWAGWMLDRSPKILRRKALDWRDLHGLTRVWNSNLHRNIKISFFSATVEFVLHSPPTQALHKPLHGWMLNALCGTEHQPGVYKVYQRRRQRGGWDWLATATKNSQPKTILSGITAVSELLTALRANYSCMF